jgi:hypothetical protein
MKTPRLVRDRRGRVRRSAHERHKLIEKFHASGLGKAAFCRRHDLHLATFCGWLKKMPVFAEVALPAPPPPIAPADAGAVRVRIELPGGVCVMVDDTSSLETLIPFIRELRSC